MGRALIGATLAVVLVGCSGQSAQQKLAARCNAEAQSWAQSFVAPENSGAANRDIPSLAASAAKACIDSGGTPPGP